MVVVCIGCSSTAIRPLAVRKQLRCNTLKKPVGGEQQQQWDYFVVFGIQVSSVLSAETGFISKVAGSITVAGSSSTTIHVLHIL